VGFCAYQNEIVEGQYHHSLPTTGKGLQQIVVTTSLAERKCEHKENAGQLQEVKGWSRPQRKER
jgi:hypothetical protein